MSLSPFPRTGARRVHGIRMFTRLGAAWALMVTVLPALAGLSDLQLRTLDGISRDRFTTRWIELNTNELAAARLRAEAYLDNLRDHHLVGGQVVSVRYTDRTRNQVVQYENLADSAMLSGLLLETPRYDV